MKLYELTIITVFLLTNSILGKPKKNNLEFLRILRFEACQDRRYKENLFDVKSFSLVPIGLDQQLINIVFKLKDIPRHPYAKVAALRCETSSPESCSAIWRFKFDFCEKLQERGTIYEEVFNHVDPPMRCPIKTATYVASNYSLKAGNFLKLFSGISGMYDYYWGVKTLYYGENNKDYACTFGMAKFYQTRKH